MDVRLHHMRCHISILNEPPQAHRLARTVDHVLDVVLSRLGSSRRRGAVDCPQAVRRRVVVASALSRVSRGVHDSEGGEAARVLGGDHLFLRCQTTRQRQHPRQRQRCLQCACAGRCERRAGATVARHARRELLARRYRQGVGLRDVELQVAAQASVVVQRVSTTAKLWHMRRDTELYRAGSTRSVARAHSPQLQRLGRVQHFRHK